MKICRNEVEALKAPDVLGMDAKRDFAAVVEHVAEVVEYALREYDSPR